MSRHRNVKQLVDEDYYDDDDDYYDDNYDDYDDVGYTGGSNKVTAAAAVKKNTKPNTAVPKSKPGVTKSPAPQKATAAAPPPKKPLPKGHTTTIAAAVTSGGGVGTTSSTTLTATTTTTTTTMLLSPPPGFAPKPPPPSPSPDEATTTTTAAAAAVLTIPPVLLQAATTPTRKVPLTVVVLGHVDAGKSTISGHLLYGADGPNRSHKPPPPPSRTANSVQRNANTNFAWLLDEDEQEREHGVTMDIATKRLTNPSGPFDIVLQDAPGHADYVPAMITGTASADAALLCVDATDCHTALGNGQLREHAYLARGLGVNQILVILNKMDVVGWDQEVTYRRMETMLMDFLIRQVGYPAARVRCIPLSGLTGTNLFPIVENGSNTNHTADADTQMLRSWYQGPTLMEAIHQFQPPASQQLSKLLEKPLRIIVSDVVESSGSLSLRAKVVSGWVKQGETLVVLPVGDTAVISKLNSLHVSTPESTTSSSSQQQLRRQYCAAGELLDCVITGIDAQRISTGSLLVRSSGRPPLSARCRSKIFVLDNGSGNGNGSAIQIPLIRGAQMIFHMHHLDVPCHVSALIRTLKPDGVTTLKERPRALTKNCTAIVELQLAVPICMEAFTDCRALGRFVLRRNGESIAVGRVEATIS